MKTALFTGKTAAEALGQLRRAFGPEAVVLNVRQIPAHGRFKRWKKNRIQIQAALPGCPLPAGRSLLNVLHQVARLNQRLPPLTEEDHCAAESILAHLSQEGAVELSSWKVTGPDNAPGARGPEPDPIGQTGSPQPCDPVFGPARETIGEAHDANPSWEIPGLLPEYAERLRRMLAGANAQPTQRTREEEWDRMRTGLAGLWRTPPWQADPASPGRHVLIGPPGVGKTVCLCKWLAKAILSGERSAEVWRLDGQTANTAEFLHIYAETVGAPVYRSASTLQTKPGADLGFIDLPGVQWQEQPAVEQSRRQLESLGPVHVHLVLNAAYDAPLLFRQIQAFASLPIDSLIFTHLDEEPFWGKLLNFVLGAKYAMSYLSIGQNVPGQFLKATLDLILQGPGPVFPHPTSRRLDRINHAKPNTMRTAG